MRRRPALVASLIVIGAGVAVAGVPRLVRSRGWAPLVELAGAGDLAEAIDGLTAGMATLRCLLHGLSVDEPTRWKLRVSSTRKVSANYAVGRGVFGRGGTYSAGGSRNILGKSVSGTSLSMAWGECFEARDSPQRNDGTLSHG